MLIEPNENSAPISRMPKTSKSRKSTPTLKVKTKKKEPLTSRRRKSKPRFTPEEKTARIRRLGSARFFRVCYSINQLRSAAGALRP